MSEPSAPAELLDDLRADPEAVAESLRNITRANRWFGGLAAVRAGASWVLDGAWGREDQLVLLDVGAGAGDVAMMLIRWAGGRGVAVRAFALERHPAAARVAHQHLPTVLACGTAIPLASAAADLVILSQVAHHLDPDTAVRLLAECDRVARLGVVVADLRPSRPAELGFRLAGRLLGFDRWTLDDGVTSLRRGFSVADMRRLCEAAGVGARVWTRPGRRVVAAWRKA